jgi:hypothetical protein
MTIIKQGGKVLKGWPTDSLIEVQSQSVPNGAEAIFDLSQLSSRLNTRARARGVKLFLLGCMVAKKQSVTIAQNPARPAGAAGDVFCTMFQRLGKDSIYFDVPDSSELWWENNPGPGGLGLNSAASLTFWTMNVINPRVAQSLIMRASRTRGSWPQYTSNDSDFTLSAPDNGVVPCADKLLGFWGSDLRRQTLAHNRAAPIQEPSFGDAEADFAVFALCRSSTDATIDGLPLAAFTVANKSAKVRYTPNDCGMYDVIAGVSAATYSTAELTLYVLIREYRVDAGGKAEDTQNYGMPWRMIQTTQGVSPLNVNLHWTNPTVVIPPLFSSATTDTRNGIATPINYEPMDFAAVLAANAQQQVEEQSSTGGDNVVVFPPDEKDLHPGKFIELWNFGTKGGVNGHVDNGARYRSELVESAVKTLNFAGGPWCAHTRYGETLANSNPFTTSGRGTLGSYSKDIGAHSAQPIHPLAVCLAQIGGFPGVGTVGGSITVPPQVTFTFPMPLGTNQSLVVIYDRPDSIAAIDNMACMNECNEGGAKPSDGLVDAVNNPGSDKAPLAAQLVGSVRPGK